MRLLHKCTNIGQGVYSGSHGPDGFVCWCHNAIITVKRYPQAFEFNIPGIIKRHGHGCRIAPIYSSQHREPSDQVFHRTAHRTAMASSSACAKSTRQEASESYTPSRW